MKTIEINKNLAFFSSLLISLVGLLVFLAYKFSPMVGHVTYYCQSFINAYMVPIPYYINLIPAFLLSIIMIISFIKFFSLIVRAQILKNSLSRSKVVNPILKKLSIKLGISNQTFVVNSENKFAFCFGVRSPKIYVSTGLLSQLSLKETEAVLLHETYHLKKHDTFTMIIATFAHSIFPFFPLLGDLAQMYRVRREIDADKYATKHMGSTHALTKTLKKLLEYPTFGIPPIAAIADGDTLEPRIYSLLNRSYNKRNFQLKNFIITLFSSLVFLGVLVFPVHAKEIHHKEHDVMMLCTDGSSCMSVCASDQNMKKLYSEMPSLQSSSISNLSRSFSPTH